MKKTPHTIDGQFIRSFIVDGKRERPSLKEQIQRAKRARTDARLVQMFTK